MTRATILAEARTIFARQGYAETSLREIAEAVGIKTPSLYAHFPSKEALFAEIMVQLWERSMAQIELAYRTDKPLREQLRQLLQQKLDSLGEVA